MTVKNTAIATDYSYLKDFIAVYLLVWPVSWQYSVSSHFQSTMGHRITSPYVHYLWFLWGENTTSPCDIPLQSKAL